jgi:hypothetical protein
VTFTEYEKYETPGQTKYVDLITGKTDVTAMKKLLTSSNMEFKSENVICMFDPSQKEFLDVIHDLKEHYEQENLDPQTLFIYFSCHAVSVKGKLNVVIPGQKPTFFSIDNWATAMAKKNVQVFGFYDTFF